MLHAACRNLLRWAQNILRKTARLGQNAAQFIKAVAFAVVPSQRMRKCIHFYTEDRARAMFHKELMSVSPRQTLLQLGTAHDHCKFLSITQDFESDVALRNISHLPSRPLPRIVELLR